jgi:hypothetical protein
MVQRIILMYPLAILALIPVATSYGYANPPTGGVGFDYQLGTPYKPHSNVKIVTRDRLARPEPDLYNICYVNAF